MRDAGVDLPAEPGLPGAEDPYPPVLTISMAKVETLRYGENPHQPAARYRRTDREPRAGEGPFASGEPPLQGKALSYNNVLDASAAAVAGTAAAGTGRRHRQAHQPVRRGGARDAARGLGRGARRRPGVGVRRRGRGHRDRRPRRSPERLTSLFLEVVVAPAFDDAALEVLAGKPNLRLVVDPSLDAAADRSGLTARGLLEVDYLGSLRTAGGAVLVTAPDRAAGRSRRLGPGLRAPAHGRRAAGPRPRLAPVPGGRLERDRPRAGRHAGRARLGAGQPRRRLPPGRRQGAPVPGRGRGTWRGRGLGRVLPVRRRPGAAARGRRDAPSSSPAARCATPRCCVPSRRPARRCW